LALVLCDTLPAQLFLVSLDDALKDEGVNAMLAAIAAILIVLWLLGFLAFHVSSGLIHVLLVIGIVVLILHFLRGSRN
jgi:hypothetical protein